MVLSAASRPDIARKELPKISRRPDGRSSQGKSSKIFRRTESDDGDILYHVSLTGRSEDFIIVDLEDIFDFVSPQELEDFENRIFDEQKALEDISDDEASHSSDSERVAEEIERWRSPATGILSSMIPTSRKRQRVASLDDTANFRAKLVVRDASNSPPSTHIQKSSANDAHRSDPGGKIARGMQLNSIVTEPGDSAEKTTVRLENQPMPSSRASSSNSNGSDILEKFGVTSMVEGTRRLEALQKGRGNSPPQFDSASLAQSSSDDEGDEEEYEVEKILADCLFDQRERGYRVKWVGYGEDANTWERESTLLGALDLVAEYWILKGEPEVARSIRAKRLRLPDT